MDELRDELVDHGGDILGKDSRVGFTFWKDQKDAEHLRFIMWDDLRTPFRVVKVRVEIEEAGDE